MRRRLRTVGSAVGLMGALALALGACTDTRTSLPDAGDGDAAASGPDSAFMPPGEGGLSDSDVDPDDRDVPDVPDVPDADADADTDTDTDGDIDPWAPDDGEVINGPDVDLPPPPPRACEVTFTYSAPPGTTSVTVPNAAIDWEQSEWGLTEGASDVWSGTFDVSGFAPGPYGYKFLRNGADWLFDPNNPMRVFDGEFENSKYYVPNCAVPLLELEELEVDATAGHIRAQVVVHNGSGGALQAGSAQVLHHGELLANTYFPDSQRFVVELEGLPEGKHSLTFRISNAAGAAEPLWLPLWVEPEPYDWRDGVMYFAFVDRFRDGGASAGGTCPSAHPLTGWLGGDWVGLRQKVEEGYFDDLGVDIIWLTAPNDNPDECMDGDIPGITYTAYHGYFPQSNTAAENQLGGMQALRDFVRAAHARGIRVLVDLVLNHVYETHPLYASNPEWFNPFCQCGVQCPWNEFPEECWFQDYLPDLDFRFREPVDIFSDMAVYWAREADLDGYRVDAVKHVHMHMLTTLRARLDQLTAAVGEPLYLVGETFVGTWGGGNGSEELLIKKYISPELLDGQFDFPLYWKVVAGFARFEEGLDSLGSFLVESKGFYGSQAVMSTFLGNHDVPRFSSHAAGQIGDLWGNGAKEQGLFDPPPQPQAGDVYERLRLAYSFLFCSEGIPLIYYGDEIGLAGAGDPDNRRMMPWTGWTGDQQATFSHLGALAKIRRAAPELARGSIDIITSSWDTLVFSRSHAGRTTVCGFNRAAQPAPVTVPAPGTWSGKAVQERISGQSLGTPAGTLAVELPARGAVILNVD